MSNLRVITPEEWQEMSRNTDMMLIDLRSQKYYRKYHIEGAVNIPYEQIRKIAPFRKKDLLLYCDQGITSTAAGLMLAQRGYHVSTLQGGIQAYLRKYPITKL